jgi:hypothetical protein
MHFTISFSNMSLFFLIAGRQLPGKKSTALVDRV